MGLPCVVHLFTMMDIWVVLTFVLSIESNAAMDIHVLVFVSVHIFFSLGCIPIYLCYVVTLYLIV